MKAIEEQKAAEERMKEQRMREEEQARQKCEEDKRKATKEYEMKLKQQLREEYIKDMEKEKWRLEMQKIEEKYSSELRIEVCKDMGLLTLPAPNLDPASSPNPGTSYPPYGNKPTFSSHQVIHPSGITPFGLLAKVKQEKYHRSELADPDNQCKPSPSPWGDKWQLDAGGDSTPPAK